MYRATSSVICSAVASSGQVMGPSYSTCTDTQRG